MDGGGGGGGAGGVMVGSGGGPRGGWGGDGDVELINKMLEFKHKLFYFDLMENMWGRYLKISEKTSVMRSTIIVPVDGITWFLDLFDYYIRTKERDAFSKELRLETKMFYFDIGKNRRGRFLKVSEISINRNRSTIIVPAGKFSEEGWKAFRNVLLEINNEASRPYVIPNHPNQQYLEPPEHLPGQSASGVEVDVERLVDLPPQEEISGMDMSRGIRADHKKFFFDLGSNNRGHYLKISEVTGANRSTIILPLSGLKQFHEMVGGFVDTMKDKLEGMAGAKVRTVEPR